MKPNLRAELQDSQSWEARLQYWTSALAKQPNNPAVWRWRIQIRVLKFLSSRYAGRTFEGSTHTSKLLPNFALPENPKPALPVPIMRRVLGHIVETNKNKPQEPPTLTKTSHPNQFQFLLIDLYDWGKGDSAPLWARRLFILSRHFPNVANGLLVFAVLLVGPLLSFILYFLLPFLRSLIP